MQRIEHQPLEHDAHNQKAHGGTEHLAHEEEPCAGAVGPLSEAILEVPVDGYKVAAVEHGHKQECYHEIAHDEAEHHLEVGIALVHHHAGHGNECNA